MDANATITKVDTEKIQIWHCRHAFATGSYTNHALIMIIRVNHFCYSFCFCAGDAMRRDAMRFAQAQHQNWVWDAVFSADSFYIVTASSDHSAKLWDVSSVA